MLPTAVICMNAPVFVDTNILIYAHDSDAGEKGEIASQQLSELWESGEGRLSVQVLQEFFVNVTRKIEKPLPVAAAREIIRIYRVWARHGTGVDEVLRATEIQELNRLSFWDSLIVASAEKAGAGTILSEDLNPGQVISGIRVVNPF